MYTEHILFMKFIDVYIDGENKCIHNMMTSFGVKQFNLFFFKVNGALNG